MSRPRLMVAKWVVYLRLDLDDWYGSALEVEQGEMVVLTGETAAIGHGHAGGGPIIAVEPADNIAHRVVSPRWGSAWCSNFMMKNLVDVP